MLLLINNTAPCSRYALVLISIIFHGSVRARERERERQNVTECDETRCLSSIFALTRCHSYFFSHWNMNSEEPMTCGMPKTKRNLLFARFFHSRDSTRIEKEKQKLLMILSSVLHIFNVDSVKCHCPFSANRKQQRGEDEERMAKTKCRGEKVEAFYTYLVCCETLANIAFFSVFHSQNSICRCFLFNLSTHHTCLNFVFVSR